MLELLVFLIIFLIPHLIVAMVVIFTWLHHARVLAGRVPESRPLPALDVVRGALARGAETGRPIHISPGAGSIGNQSMTGETIVGLLAAERVASEATLKGAPVLASSGDAVAYLALRGTIRQAYQRAGQPHDYDASMVKLLAHEDGIAYATGVMTLQDTQKIEASQLLGSFGREFLLLGEDGAQRDVPQVSGTTSANALPGMLLSTQGTLIGEEIFAAEAYLSDEPTPRARLITQDVLRTMVILLILIGLIYVNVQPIIESSLGLSLPSLSNM